MSYITEHWGNNGAESQHEQAVTIAVSSILAPVNEKIILAGAKEFLDALLSLWNILDLALLGSGYLS